MKRLVTTLILSFFAFWMPVTVHAQYVPQPPVEAVFLNKQVLNPQNNTFVENLGSDVFLFLPNQDVVFKVDVRNTTQNEIRNLTVTDKLPGQVNFLSSSAGSYNANNHSVSVFYDRVGVNETKSFEIRTKIKSAENLSGNVLCPSNFVEAKTGNMLDQDSASFCVTKQVLGVVSELPKTGPAGVLLTAFGSLASLGLSLYLFRKVKN